VGTPAINLFEAVIDGEKIIAVPEKFEFPLQPICRSRLGELAGPRAKVRIGARPEHVRLVSSGGVEGTVYGVENHGVEMVVTISVADHFFRATMPPTNPLALNQRVRIAFTDDKLHFFDAQTTENLAVGKG